MVKAVGFAEAYTSTSTANPATTDDYGRKFVLSAGSADEVPPSCFGETGCVYYIKQQILGGLTLYVDVEAAAQVFPRTAPLACVGPIASPCGLWLLPSKKWVTLLHAGIGQARRRF